MNDYNQIQLEKGITLQSNNQLDMAEKIYKQILSSDAKDFNDLYLLGTIKAQKNENEEIETQEKEPIQKPTFEVVEDMGLSGQAKVIKKTFVLPDTSFMAKTESVENNQLLQDELQNLSLVLKAKLKQFGITGEVTDIHSGPVVTLFEYKLLAPSEGEGV